jgi:N-succinyldiaminopimelate aminotransferase
VLLSPGDEVVLLEPFFDLYVGQIKMARGVPKYVSLQPDNNSWHLDAAALRAAITPQTRAIVLNSPHNPTGIV